VAVYLVSWLVALKSPLSLEYEGPCLWAAMELCLGHNIYDTGRLTSEPWVVTIYTPLYFLLAAPFQNIGGFNYWSLRAISMAAFAACMFYFYKLLLIYGARRLSAIIGLLLMASYIPLWHWSFNGRVDMLALSLSIVSLYLFELAFARAGENQENQVWCGSYLKQVLLRLGPYLPSTLVLSLAVFTKQPSLVVLPAVCAALLLKRRYVDLLAYLLSTLAICGILFLAIDMITQGGFLAHMKFCARMPFAWSDLDKHLSWMGVDWFKLWPLPVMAVLWLRRSKRREALALPLVLAIISGALTVYTIGTMYANLNHGFIFFMALTWLTVIFLETYTLAAGVVLIGVSSFSTYIIGTQMPGLLKNSDRMGESIELIKKLPLSGRTIFVEDPALAITCGATPLFVDVATFLQVWHRDRVSLAPLRKAIAEKRYPALIINLNDSLEDKPNYFWPDYLLETVEDNYDKHEYVIGNGELQQVYVPKYDR
jgi:4-amino-4-deoxy-L-arabinose transferase-like glycosyltransferase